MSSSSIMSSPDDVIVGMLGQRGVQVCDFASLRLLRDEIFVLPPASSGVCGCCSAGDGYVAFGTTQGPFDFPILELSSGRVVRRCSGHHNIVYKMISFETTTDPIAGGSSTIISASDDTTIRIWNAETAVEVASISPDSHSYVTSQLQYSSRRTRLYFGNQNGDLVDWNVERPDDVVVSSPQMVPRRMIYALALGAEEMYVVPDRTNEVIIFSMNVGLAASVSSFLLAGDFERVLDASFHEDSHCLLVYGNQNRNGVLQVYDVRHLDSPLRTFRLLTEIDHQASLCEIVQGGEEVFFVVPGGPRLVRFSLDGKSILSRRFSNPVAALYTSFSPNDALSNSRILREEENARIEFAETHHRCSVLFVTLLGTSTVRLSCWRCLSPSDVI